MEKHKFSAKTESAAKEQALYELKTEEKNIIYTTKEVKAGLFGKKVEIEVIKKEDVIDLIKTTLLNITSKMGIDSKIEVKDREEVLNLVIYCDQNALLIGKQGKNLQALNTIIRQVVLQEVGQPFKFNLDIGEYKLKRQKELERLAKKTAKEVAKTKIEARMDSMNSYERRIIHNVLNDWKNIYTESDGEEPNRCVVIKPKEDK